MPTLSARCSPGRLSSAGMPRPAAPQPLDRWVSPSTRVSSRTSAPTTTRSSGSFPSACWSSAWRRVEPARRSRWTSAIREVLDRVSERFGQRNPHMKGTTTALRVLFGREPGTDRASEELVTNHGQNPRARGLCHGQPAAVLGREGRNDDRSLDADDEGQLPAPPRRHHRLPPADGRGVAGPPGEGAVAAPHTLGGGAREADHGTTTCGWSSAKVARSCGSASTTRPTTGSTSRGPTSRRS